MFLNHNSRQLQQKIFLRTLSLLLIVYFIGFRAFFLIHQLSHFNSGENIEVKNLAAQLHSGQKSQQNLYKNSAKTNFVDKKNHHQQKKTKSDKDCLICHLANFYHHNILLLIAAAFALPLFYFANFIRQNYQFNSYHFSFFYQAQAPPIVII